MRNAYCLLILVWSFLSRSQWTKISPHVFTLSLNNDRESERQRRKVPSSEPETTCRPSGENVTWLTSSVCPCHGSPACVRVSMSQSLRVQSAEPDTMYFPSGETATEKTFLLWPVNGSPMCALVCTSQMLIVLSDEPETIFWPSGENMTNWTRFPCPVKMRLREETFNEIRGMNYKSRTVWAYSGKSGRETVLYWGQFSCPWWMNHQSCQAARGNPSFETKMTERPGFQLPLWWCALSVHGRNLYYTRFPWYNRIMRAFLHLWLGWNWRMNMYIFNDLPRFANSFTVCDDALGLSKNCSRAFLIWSYRSSSTHVSCSLEFSWVLILCATPCRIFQKLTSSWGGGDAFDVYLELKSKELWIFWPGWIFRGFPRCQLLKWLNIHHAPI